MLHLFQPPRADQMNHPTRHRQVRLRSKDCQEALKQCMRSAARPPGNDGPCSHQRCLTTESQHVTPIAHQTVQQECAASSGRGVIQQSCTHVPFPRPALPVPEHRHDPDELPKIFAPACEPGQFPTSTRTGRPIGPVVVDIVLVKVADLPAQRRLLQRDLRLVVWVVQGHNLTDAAHDNLSHAMCPTKCGHSVQAGPLALPMCDRAGLGCTRAPSCWAGVAPSAASASRRAPSAAWCRCTPQPACGVQAALQLLRIS